MTYEEAIKYLTPHPTSQVVNFKGDQLREALEAIKDKVSELENELIEAGEFGYNLGEHDDC